MLANDTTLTLRGTCLANTENIANHELSKQYQCPWSNRISINTDETFYTILSKPKMYPSLLNSNNIQTNSETGGKFLGVVIDQNLPLQSHIENIEIDRNYIQVIEVVAFGGSNFAVLHFDLSTLRVL